VSLDLGTAVAGDAERQTRARRRDTAQLAFYIHLLSYLGVIALLAFMS